MSGKFVRCEQGGAILEITLDKPKVNAICRQLSRELYEAACTLQADPDLKAGLLTASGDRVFSAGWDFNEALNSVEQGRSSSESDEEAGWGPGGFGGITALWTLRKPLIAAVNGAAVGGGFELALACDVIVMAEHAFFQLPEMQRGILPDGGGVQRLPRRIPYNVAVEMMLTGRKMTAEEAHKWGLVHAVCPSDRLAAEARRIAENVTRAAPLALQALKEVLTAIERMPLKDAMAIAGSSSDELPIYRRMAVSEDAVEGPRAFLERRTPVWKGR
jgi:crotonobetainyl-CoA hydratase